MLPRFHLDIAAFGDEILLKDRWKTRPPLRVLGHVHGGYGKEYIVYDRLEARREGISRGIGGLYPREIMFSFQSNIIRAQEQ